MTSIAHRKQSSTERHTISDLELPTDEPMVIIRSSFLWICDGDKYAAAALNMYVRWTRWIIKHRPIAEELNRVRQNQGKHADQDTSLIIYRKQSAFLQDLLGFCSEKRLRQANALLIAKGLLKIDDTPRSISDHILKYELQIDVFKKRMEEWKKQRKNADTSTEDNVTEVGSEADSDGTDNLPSRNGTFTAQASVRNGKFTDRNGKNAVSINRGYEIDDTLTDDHKERDSVSANNPQDNTTEQVSLTPQKLLHEKIELFRMAFIALGKEHFTNKFFTGKVAPNSDIAAGILAIIGDGEVDAQGMRRAFLKLWNSKNKDGSYWWREKSKLTLRAFVNNYDDQEDVQPSNPYVEAILQQQLRASTPGSQYIVDELSDAAEAQLRDDGLIFGYPPEYWTEDQIVLMRRSKDRLAIRRALRQREEQQQLITTGPLAGQPDYHADPWT